MLTEAKRTKLRSHRPSVRKSLAANYKSPLETLSLYASDPDPDVRRRVAANQNTPIEVLHSLVSDPDASVRRGLLENRGRAPELLITLAHDTDEKLRSEVLRFLGAESVANDMSQSQKLRVLARTNDVAVCVYVARHPDTPIPCLWDLTLSPFPVVRLSAGMNPALGVEGRLVLTADESPAVRRQLAENERVDRIALERLLCDTSPEVRRAASTSSIVEDYHRLKLAADMASGYEGLPYSLAEALDAILE